MNNTPSTPSCGRTKIDDWVRALAFTVPARTPAQLRQLQFHCGKPPPAEEPSTLMRMKKICPGKPRRKREGETKSADAAPMALRRRPVNQRALTYIVISKPKRRSQAVGVVHCIKGLLK